MALSTQRISWLLQRQVAVLVPKDAVAHESGIVGQVVEFKLLEPQQNCPAAFWQVVKISLQRHVMGVAMLEHAAGVAQVADGKVA